jgi:copper chaperone
MKFHVPDMSCGHCVATIEKALKAADPMATLRTDLNARTAERETAVSSDAISQVLATAGYPSTALDGRQ